MKDIKEIILVLDQVCSFTSNSSIELENLLNNTTIPELQNFLNKSNESALCVWSQLGTYLNNELKLPLSVNKVKLLLDIVDKLTSNNDNNNISTCTSCELFLDSMNTIIEKWLSEITINKKEESKALLHQSKSIAKPIEAKSLKYMSSSIYELVMYIFSGLIEKKSYLKNIINYNSCHQIIKNISLILPQDYSYGSQLLALETLMRFYIALDKNNNNSSSNKRKSNNSSLTLKKYPNKKASIDFMLKCLPNVISDRIIELVNQNQLPLLFSSTRPLLNTLNSSLSLSSSSSSKSKSQTKIKGKDKDKDIIAFNNIHSIHIKKAFIMDTWSTSINTNDTNVFTTNDNNIPSYELEGVTWLDLNKEKACFTCSSDSDGGDYWVSFPYNDIRRVHCVNNTNHSDAELYIIVERMPRNFEIVLEPLLSSSTSLQSLQSSKSKVFPTMKFILENDNKCNTNTNTNSNDGVVYLDYMISCFNNRLQKVEYDNLYSREAMESMRQLQVEAEVETKDEGESKTKSKASVTMTTPDKYKSIEETSTTSVSVASTDMNRHKKNLLVAQMKGEDKDKDQDQGSDEDNDFIESSISKSKSKPNSKPKSSSSSSKVKALVSVTPKNTLDMDIDADSDVDVNDANDGVNTTATPSAHTSPSATSTTKSKSPSSRNTKANKKTRASLKKLQSPITTSTTENKTNINTTTSSSLVPVRARMRRKSKDSTEDHGDFLANTTEISSSTTIDSTTDFDYKSANTNSSPSTKTKSKAQHKGRSNTTTTSDIASHVSAGQGYGYDYQFDYDQDEGVGADVGDDDDYGYDYGDVPSFAIVDSDTNFLNPHQNQNEDRRSSRGRSKATSSSSTNVMTAINATTTTSAASGSANASRSSSDTGEDDDEGESTNFMGLLFAQLMSSQQQKENKKRTKRSKDAMHRASSSIDGFVNQWVEFSDMSCSKAKKSVEYNLNEMQSQCDLLQRNINVDVTRLQTEVDDLENAFAKLENIVLSNINNMKKVMNDAKYLSEDARRDFKRLQKNASESFTNASKKQQDQLAKKNKKLVEAFKDF